MKRKIYTPLLLTALFMSTLSQTVPGTTANAAKKPALSKTKVSVYTGKKAKVSIKKIAKKTKVTWKLGNKKVAKIVKQKKTGKPYAVIQGVKKGKTTLLARYKQGKKIRKLTCRITVLAAKKATPQKNAAVPSSTASPSQAPNSSPAITPTPEPNVGKS